MAVITRDIWEYDENEGGSLRLETVSNPDAYGLSIVVNSLASAPAPTDFYEGTHLIDQSTKIEYAQISGAWVPVGGGTTGVMPPAYAGPRRDAGGGSQALFSHINAPAGVGYAIDTGTLYVITAANGNVQMWRANASGVPNEQFAVFMPRKFYLTPWILANRENDGLAAILPANDEGVDSYKLIDYNGQSLWNCKPGTSHSWRVGNIERMSMSTTFSLGVDARIYANLTVDNGITSLVDVAATRRFWQNGPDTGFGPDWNQAHYVVSGAGYYGGRFAANYGGTAVQWRVAQWEPNEWAAVNMNMGGYVPVAGSSFHTMSTVKTKRDIRSLYPDRERPYVHHDIMSLEAPDPDIMALRPVAFRPLVPELEWDEETETAREATHPILVHKGNRERIGLIAEEVATIIPSAVSLDLDGNPRSIDYAQITVALLGHVQQLTATIETLKYRISELENAT